MRKALASAFVCFLGAISVGAAMAQDRPIDFSSKGANVFSAPGAQSLSLPSQAAPAPVVASFLHSQGYLPETVASLVVTSEGPVSRTGLTHLRFAQEVEGLTVYGTYVKAAVNDDGELVHLIENLATPPAFGLLPTVIGERAALDAALEEVHPGVFVTLIQGLRDGNTMRFSGDEFFYQDPAVTRVAIPMQSGVLQEGYLVETWTDEGNLLHHTLIGGAGQVLKVELRTNNDSYNIFPDHPDESPQEIVSGPGPGNAESPLGWLSGSQTTENISGNNVNAYLDVNADNLSDPGGYPVTDGNFLTSADLAQQPDTAQNQEVAVQNLFYFNNVIHDTLYGHGFTEAARNFQEDNDGLGGLGSDSVNAEAQDGWGFNNANFATPADGSNPRMQMFLWNPGDHLVEITGGPTYDAVGATFGPSPNVIGLTGEVVVVNDNTGTTSDGCEAIINEVTDKIALIDRGTCDFVVKVQNAQDAGAIGVIVANNVVTGISAMADNGDGYTITIPSVFISQSDGNAIKAALPVNATLKMTQLMRDGDVDSDIIWHEYGHGLTWRMIGGMTGSMSGAIGEGMSDVLAILANDDDVVGEYSIGNSNGLRSRRYTGYSSYRTYGDFSASLGVHRNGEIYAAAVWRVWELFKLDSVPQDDLFDYLIDGMNYTASGPAMEDMRDGILQSAAGSGNECLIWEGFAELGIGDGAEYRREIVTESFDLPPECTGGGGNSAPVAKNDGPYGVAEGGAVVVSVVDGVLGNDINSDGPLALTAEVVSEPSNGGLTLNPDGSFSYTHDGSETASDSFTYRAYDGAAYSSPATVSITVTAVNDAPVADAQSLNTKKNTPLAVTLTASDVDGDVLVFTIVSGPSHGTLSGSGADLTYTPDNDYTGKDSFDFGVDDGNGGAGGATVSINVKKGGGGSGGGGSGGGCKGKGKKSGCP